MRLIDADEIDFNEVFVGASKFAEDTRQAGKMLIDAQPTAYDVDKVLEQLEYSRVPNTGIAGYHKVIKDLEAQFKKYFMIQV